MPCCEEEYYDTSAYKTVDLEGVYTGDLVYTAWGKSGNKIGFIDLEDGRKIVVHTWNRETNYFGLREMPYGSKVKITLSRNGKGRIYLTDLFDYGEQAWEE